MSPVMDVKPRAYALPQAATLSSPYIAYAYSYPHKTAYRALNPPRRLARVWEGENRDALFAYIHIPFCEMRCGFCNLFTTANPHSDLAEAYIDALRRQAACVSRAIGDTRYARMAIGGGTPTFLTAGQLERVLRMSAEILGIRCGSIPISAETSPRTAEMDRLGVLKDFGVERISIGVQSFVESEVVASARAQKNEWVQTALGRIRKLEFRTLNIDLIYGLPGQGVESWLTSLRMALEWRPEELYLYPLYVRPLTGLERRGCESLDQLRLSGYRVGRELLLATGYEQVSMRMFRRTDVAAPDDLVYCCQDDGMVGLGCGARSYTSSLHYSTEYAVGAGGVSQIITEFLRRTDEQFEVADYGCELCESERRRRWVIKSVFRTAGLDRRAYRAMFGADVLGDFPELALLAGEGYFQIHLDCLKPTELGLEWSDALGPMLFSDAVAKAMAEYDLH